MRLEGDGGSERVFAFGVFEFREATLELRRRGLRVALPEQSATILLLLLRRSGQEVSRAQLREVLWGEEVHVDFQHSLNNAVNRLRRALGDSAKDARYVETLSGRGYRFSAPVRVLAGGDPQEGMERSHRSRPILESLPSDVGDALSGEESRFSRHAVLTVALLVLIACAVWLADSFEAGELSQADASASGVDEPAAASEDQLSQAAGRQMHPQAYEAYLRGRYYWQRRLEGGFGKAVQELERAAAIDPSAAPVQELLAQAYAKQAYWSLTPPQSALRRAQASARIALQGNPSSAQAHAVLARAAMALHWDWERAGRHLRQALANDPEDASVHLWRAELLAVHGRSEQALAEVRQARTLDPEALSTHAALGWHLYLARRYDDAIAHLQDTLEMQPRNFLAASHLGWALLAAGRAEEARRAFLEGTQPPDNPPPHVAAGLGCALAAAGRAEEARARLEELQGRLKHTYIAPVHFAQILAALGRNEEALDHLEQALADHLPWLRRAAVDPIYDRLRAEPRFQALLQRIGLEAPSDRPLEALLAAQPR